VPLLQFCAVLAHAPETGCALCQCLVNAAQGATRLEPSGSDSRRVRKEGDLTGPLATQ
jgi:hypothetical protein